MFTTTLFKSKAQENPPSTTQYIELYQDENDSQPPKSEETILTTRHKTNSYMKYSLSAILGALSTLCVILIIHITHPSNFNSSPNSSSNLPDKATSYDSCGSTPAEARAAGCLFEYMTFNWMPPRCFDFELVAAEYNTSSHSHTEYPWSRTPLSSEPLSDPNNIPEAEVLSGEYDGLYGSNNYHKTHCTFAWKKFHRAVLGGGPVDTYLANYEHTKHCEMMLLELTDGDRTRTRVKYAMCPRV